MRCHRRCETAPRWLLDWSAYRPRMPGPLPPAPSDFGTAVPEGSGPSGGPRRALIPARVSPQLTSNLDRVDADLFPPCPLIADAMNRPVMDPAQRGNEFIAHLPAECTRLHEAQVMGIGRFSPAHETGLLGDEPQMLFVAIATRLSDCEYALVDDNGRISSLDSRPC